MQGRKNERLLLRGSEVKLADAMRIGIDARVLFGPHTGDRTYLLNLLRQFAAMDLPHEFLLFTDRVEPPSLGARGEGRVRWQDDTTVIDKCMTLANRLYELAMSE
jgi:hypothetical protein